MEMAKLCDLLLVKYGVLFGDAKTIKLQIEVEENIYNLTGIKALSMVDWSQIQSIAEFLEQHNPPWRLAGLEYTTDDGEMVALAWELFLDKYDNSWLQMAIERIPSDMKVHLYFYSPFPSWFEVKSDIFLL